VLAAALREHDVTVTNLWVGEGAIGISFSSFSTMKMPKGKIYIQSRGGSDRSNMKMPKGPSSHSVLKTKRPLLCASVLRRSGPLCLPWSPA